MMIVITIVLCGFMLNIILASLYIDATQKKYMNME